MPGSPINLLTYGALAEGSPIEGTGDRPPWMRQAVLTFDLFFCSAYHFH